MRLPTYPELTRKAKIMRKEITKRTLYTFDELSEEAQDKALEKLWDINVDCYDWWECTVDDIDEFGKVSQLGCVYGKEFDLDRADYLSIKDFSCLFSELYKAWPETKKAYPDITEEILDSFFKEFSSREIKWLLRLEKYNLLSEMTGETSRQRRSGYSDIDTALFSVLYHKRCSKLIEKLENAWQDLVNGVEHYYKKMLRKEYEYMTSREAIIESINCNNYEFLKDGALA